MFEASLNQMALASEDLRKISVRIFTGAVLHGKSSAPDKKGTAKAG